MSTATQLLDIQPRELKFIFELKKQSSCSVRLMNVTNKTIAFKVKTTNPKKYCVRPNVGIVLPESTLEFTVIMQAQKVPPPDMVCKDKFLIQSAIVPFGTMDEDITSSMFSKDDGKYVEEIKLRVSLVSPPQSPELSPINGDLKPNPFFENVVVSDLPILTKSMLHSPKPSKDVEIETNNVHEFSTATDNESKLMRRIGSLESKPVELKMNANHEFTVEDEGSIPFEDEHQFHAKTVEDSALVRDGRMIHAKEVDDSTLVKDDLKFPAKEVKDLTSSNYTVDDENLKPLNKEDLKPGMDTNSDNQLKDTEPLREEDLKPGLDANGDDQLKLPKDTASVAEKDVEFVHVKAVDEQKLVGDIEEMKSKLNALESKLHEAEATILKLTQERKLRIQEREVLQEQLAVLRSKTIVKRVHVGFPLLFVVMVGFISTMLGYLSHT